MLTDTNLDLYHLLFRLLFSLAIGLVIGLERERQHKAAGLRTSVLICLGATIFTIGSLEFGKASGTVDPSRVAAGIVTGIGFLGAGAIIQTRGSVHGLTTAATIWVMAALGLAVGLGAYILAAGGAVLAIIVLNPFQAIERAVKGKKTTCAYTILLSDAGPALDRIMKALQRSPSEVKQLKIVNRGQHHEIAFNYTDIDEQQTRFAEELAKTEGVIQITTDQGG